MSQLFDMLESNVRDASKAECGAPRRVKIDSVQLWIRGLISVLLLTAAALKAYAFGKGHSLPILSSPRWQMGLMEIEILLGLWLFAGVFMRIVCIAGTVFFASSAAVSLYLVAVGQPSCGCFGLVQVSPWLAFAIDVSATVALLLIRPGPGAMTVSANSPQKLLKACMWTAFFVVLGPATFFLVVEDPVEAFFRLRGESITVYPSITDVGDGPVGTQREFAIALKNHTKRPIRVLGGTTNSLCIATADLPITLTPEERRAIRVQMTFQGSPGRFEIEFVLYTDDEQQPVLPARFAGRTVNEADK
jgi:hypothetical protein